MTTQVITDTITVSAENITVNEDGTFTINVKNVTELTDALLAARKEAYANLRTQKSAEIAARKAEREAKKAERETAKAKRTADAIAKTEKRLAELKAKANPAAGKSGRRAAAKK